MAKSGGELPVSPGFGRGRGWHAVGADADEEVFWDGRSWTIRRHRVGDKWVFSEVGSNKEPYSRRTKTGVRLSLLRSPRGLSPR
jgi:hypothetical protein